MTPNEFDGARAFVTGAASGIGRSTALALAARGAHVSVADSDAAGGRQTVDLVIAAGGRADYLECDVTSGPSVAAAVASAEAGGVLAYAVNCAGISGPGPSIPLLEYDTDLLDRMIDVNLRGVFRCLQAELAAMVPRRAGAIVTVASGAGLVGVSGASGYVASKHGVVGLMKSAALDYAALGIRINTVCPGLVDTPMIASGRPPEVMSAMEQAHPIGRIAQPEEIAEAIVWLCSSAASFMVGATIPVDGGYTAR